MSSPVKQQRRQKPTGRLTPLQRRFYGRSPNLDNVTRTLPARADVAHLALGASQQRGNELATAQSTLSNSQIQPLSRYKLLFAHILLMTIRPLVLLHLFNVRSSPAQPAAPSRAAFMPAQRKEGTLARLGTRDVGEVALGTAKFAFGNGTFDLSLATIKAAVEAGVVLPDTALAYTRPDVESYAESVVSEALRRFGADRVAVATKGGHWRNGDTFPVDNRPYTLRRHVEISLRSLRVEAIDLYLIHHPDPQVPIGGSVGALEELRREGKLLALGLCNVSTEQLERARTIAPMSAVQNRLSVAQRQDLPMAAHCAGIGVLYMAYQPFDGLRTQPGAVVQQVAECLGVSVNRVVLAWLRAQSPAILPIVGASRPETIRDSATAVELGPQHLAALDAMDHQPELRLPG